ncbi:hypothetical protein niasHT_005900 [Heterodera trifolii]|uniref:Reverse transcriptase domain-containing protein n=1 Tax=Heterodera trifolii TaxID=157864 RepID=A0ABD2LX52_9BILA
MLLEVQSKKFKPRPVPFALRPEVEKVIDKWVKDVVLEQVTTSDWSTPFIFKESPAIFQQVMEDVLRGIDGVTVYLDDIVVTAPNDAEHLKRLEITLERIQKFGLRVKEEKCSFMQNQQIVDTTQQQQQNVAQFRPASTVSVHQQQSDPRAIPNQIVDTTQQQQQNVAQFRPASTVSVHQQQSDPRAIPNPIFSRGIEQQQQPMMSQQQQDHRQAIMERIRRRQLSELSLMEQAKPLPEDIEHCAEYNAHGLTDVGWLLLGWREQMLISELARAQPGDRVLLQRLNVTQNKGAAVTLHDNTFLFSCSFGQFSVLQILAHTGNEWTPTNARVLGGRVLAITAAQQEGMQRQQKQHIFGAMPAQQHQQMDEGGWKSIRIAVLSGNGWVLWQIHSVNGNNFGAVNELRRSETKWHWGQQQQKAFEHIKMMLSPNELLAHFDPSKPLYLATDASDYGVGATLFLQRWNNWEVWRDRIRLKQLRQ